jgi:hydrogenase maturation protein HypF
VARITALESIWLENPPRFSGFHIQASSTGPGHSILISPDIAMCSECRAEIHDPANSRYMYPFTNCTNCGPRFTITHSVPYDRDSTCMACFPMCAACEREYHDPADRRFHAQPNACPACGPGVWSPGSSDASDLAGHQALDATVAALAQGRIVAVKGLGGFHLACLATDSRAVQRLRQRKNRPGKPLAVMVRDESAARALARPTDQDISWLAGSVRPIVLVPKRIPGPLADSLAPDTDRIGLMLPYTPLHDILLSKLEACFPKDHPAAVVMTSGNAGSEPIALGNREALERLGHIADLFLLHNRDILVRSDDSVLCTLPDRESPLLYRRARGFVPSPVALGQSGPSTLGLGPELKATVCLTKHDQAFVSQHIGDVQNLATFGFYQETIAHLQTILHTVPHALVTDLHPDFMTTRYAAEQTGRPIFALQHHTAHILAVLTENRLDQPSLGLALDGTGLGPDHTLWGGELLYVDPSRMETQRLGHFSPVALPGGDKAAAEPWRTAQSFLFSLGKHAPENREWPWLKAFPAASDMVGQMLDKGINCAVSTSCGRLFDAVSALLGLCLEIEYEGQAAIRLEQVQSREEGPGYRCPVKPGVQTPALDTMHLFAQVYADWTLGRDPSSISRWFHLGLIQGLCDWALAASRTTGLAHVALSGGVLQNATLARRLPAELAKRGLVPLVHHSLPPNDACISLGQAVYGRFRLSKG